MESCKNIMFQTEKRVSRGTKFLKTELKGRTGPKGFEDTHEAVGDRAEAAEQRYRPKVARVGMGLPRLWDVDDHRLTPAAREGV